MKKIQIIFDFDGVILASHKIKTQAFYEIFLPFGKKIATRVKNYHLKNIGVSRYKKFEYVLNNILYKNKKISKNYLDKKFNSYCDRKIERLKVSKNLLTFFKKYNKKFDFFLSTATPYKIIINILRKKKLKKYFKKVYGSPKSKIYHINKIKRNKIDRFFIGDSEEDYIASKTQTKFILKEHKEQRCFS